MDSTLPALNSLPHISKVVPLSEADSPLVEELVQVLKKHNAIERFGITLLHKHFPCSDDEVMMESTDVPTRTQTIRPVPKESLANEEYIETAWRLDVRKPIMACVCLVRDGSHSGEHAHIQ